MPTVQPNIETEMQLTDTSTVAGNGAGEPVRISSSLLFDPRASEFGESQSLPSGLNLSRVDERIVSMDVMRLHGSSYLAVDGGRSMLITHVLRQSSSALRWRNAWGEITCLEPGSVFINQGRRDSLIEISPSTPDEECDCIRIVLRSSDEAEISRRFDAHDFPFCNSPEACVRVVLGSYRQRLANASTVPNLSMLDIDIAPFSELEMPVQSDHFALAILTSGSIECGGISVEPWHVIAFDDRELLVRLATRTGASVLWFGVPR